MKGYADGPLYPGDFFRPPPNLLASLEPVPRAAWWADSERSPTDFYSAFRRLALFCKWIGCFPVTMVASSSQLSFSWSLVAFVSLAVPLLDIVVVSWGGPIENISLIVILSAYLTVSLALRLMFFSKIPFLIKLVQLLDELHDADLFKDGESKSISNKVNIIVISVVLYFLPHLSQPRTLVGNVAFANFTAAPMAICGLLLAVSYHLDGLWDRLERAVAGLRDHRCSEPLVERHRIAHVRIISCVHLVDQAFGNWLALIYVFFSLNAVFECYKFVYAVEPPLQPINFCMAMVFMSFVYYPAVVIHRFQDKNKKILVHLFKMSLNPCSDNELFQIVFFQRQVQMNEATVSAAGLADVNKEIIPKALALFASFFIAAVQIMPQIRSTFEAWEQ